MAKKSTSGIKSSYHWIRLSDDAVNKFVYFADMASYGSAKTLSVRQALAAKSQSRFEAESAALANLNADSAIDNAIGFLKGIAESERQKEIAAIKQFQNQIIKTLPTNAKNNAGNFHQYLNMSPEQILQSEDTLLDYYEHIIDYLNRMRQDATDYKQRLEQFQTHNTMEMKDLQKDDYRFRAPGDIQTVMRNLTGIADKKQKEKSTVFAHQLRQAIGKYVISSNVLQAAKSGEDIVALIAAIAFDIEHYLQRELLSQNKHDFVELNTTVDQLVQNYMNQQNQQQTHLQQAISEQSDELNNILSAVKNTFGISSITPGTRAAQKRLNEVERKTKYRNKNNSLYKTLKSQGYDERMLEEVALVKFNTISKDNRTFHGNVFEVIETILVPALQVGGTAAVDTLSLGSIEFEVLPTDIKEKLWGAARQISAAFREHSEQIRKDRLDDRTNASIAMSKIVTEQTQILDDFLKNSSEFSDGNKNVFIYHESLKLYKSAETNESSRFEGRELSILSYIDEIYSMNGLAGLQLPQKDSLQFLALNLSKLGAGKGNKGPIELFLSIFAGLLMFDDVQNMALDYATQINDYNASSSLVKNIHLYNLNGTYVPASMLLNFIYSTMNKMQSLARGTNFGAKAAIHYSEADSVITKFLSEHYASHPNRNGQYAYLGGDNSYSDYWPQVANDVASSIKVRVVFLAAFNNLMQSLLDLAT